MIDDRYSFTFSISGQQAPCSFDLRVLMCTGVPELYNEELVVENRLKHIDAIMSHILSRSDASKRNEFNYLRRYIRWCEDNNKNEFTTSAISDIERAGLDKIFIKRMKYFHAKIGAKAISGPIVPAGQSSISELSTYSGDNIREGFLFTSDGDSYIGVKSKARGLIRLSLPEEIKSLDDKLLFLTALKDIYMEASAETFIDFLNRLKHYIKTVNSNFFDESNFERYLASLDGQVKSKIRSAKLAKRKALAVLRIFDAAEVKLPAIFYKRINAMPSPRSRPVPGYDISRYKLLIKLLFRVQKSLYVDLLKDVDVTIISGENSFIELHGWLEQLRAFTTVTYYLISRYSAWTDTTIKQLKTADVEMDGSDGEWVHLKGTKFRGGFKQLNSTMTAIEADNSDNTYIRKTGYAVIKNLLSIRAKFHIHVPELLFNVSSKGEIIKFERQKRFSDFVLAEIPGLQALNSQRIRETEISIAHKRGFQSAVSRSGSSAAVVSRHYSEGSPLDKSKELSRVVSSLSEAANSGLKKESVREIKSRLYTHYKIDVISGDKQTRSNTPMGTYCRQPSLESVFSRKAEKQSIGKLVCADLLACFSCQHAAVIDSVDEVWSFLSFKERLKEGRIFSIDREHYEKNFNEVLAKIELIIEQFTPDNVQAAALKLKTDGSHPFWDEDELF